MAEPTPDLAPYTPRRPTLAALALLGIWVVILFVPALSGQFLGGLDSDQTWAGIPFRQFWADEVARTGHIPQWNPYMFGGLPFIAAMHGDTFYPLSFLRLFLRADHALTAWFAIHLVLAGVFAYAFLRTIRVTWSGAVVGGLAYQLAGIVTSQASPGHDGKLAVSALLPLLLTGLVLAVQRRRLEGYGIVALTVGFAILSPQTQMAQYALILAGLFSLWLVFASAERPETPRQRVVALGLATLAVVLGFAIAAIQLLPFVANSPFAARWAGAQGWAYATGWSMPPENLLDALVPEFTGILDRHWGSNQVKLHSEYVGAATLMLAAVGVVNAERRRFVWFAVGAALLFVLVSLGGHTPFYRLWYEVVPGAKVTRASGMAFFIPTFLACALAAFGVEQIERGRGRRVLLGGLAAAALLLLLGASGGLGIVAESLARPTADLPVDRTRAALDNADAIALGAVRSAIVIALAAGLSLAWLSGRLRAGVAAIGVALLVGADQYSNARRFFHWSPGSDVLYADDPLTNRILATPPPYRVLDLPAPNGAYKHAYLMGKRIPTVLGYHGNELHAYDQLLGGKNEWANLLTSTRLWDLLAVRFVLISAPISIPGYSPVAQHAIDGPGQGPLHRASLLEADTAPPYARVVPAAVKVPRDQLVQTLMDPRLDFDRILLLDPDAPVEPPPLDSQPPPSASRAAVAAWEPGAMTIRLDPAPEAGSYVLVSENWHPDWHATVDGVPARVLRGNQALIAVPVDAGAREVRLHVASGRYRQGRAVTVAALLAGLLWVAVPLIRRRRRA